MCFAITGDPSASPSKLTLPGDVTIKLGLRSETPADVTVTCRPGALGANVSRTERVDGDREVSIPLALDGEGAGTHQIDVEITQEGCAPRRRTVRVIAV